MKSLKIHTNAKRLLITNLMILLAAICVMIYDIIIDLNAGVHETHVYHELIIFIPLFLTLLVTGFFYYKSTSRMYDDVLVKDFELGNLKIENLALINNNELLSKALSIKISTQFDIWKLTKVEKEIGMLLIKGFPTKEIGLIRMRSEKTIREQASSIYQKSGLKNRAELASFFIEDIL